MAAMPSSAGRRPSIKPESAGAAGILARVQEQTLTERLISYETDTPEGVRACAGFVKGWLEARDVEVKDGSNNDLPVLAATVGAERGPTVVLHGHIDVVPGHADQFKP